MIEDKYVSNPAQGIAEITLIGTGAYGESAVCHIGDNNWIIIDSCLNPDDPETPLPIAYLKKIGVEPAQISKVICTHWHDDHVKGIGNIMGEAINADFCISRAHDRDKFLAFIGMDAIKSNSSTREFSKALLHLKKRNKIFLEAIEDRPIFKNRLSNVICLSPSDYTTQNYDLEIANINTKYQAANIRIPYTSPNMRSIALFLKLGHHRALLGADLEIGDANQGWVRILKNNISIDAKSSLFKISHHGSETGYHKDVWNSLLHENPIAKLTPWRRGGNILPNEAMLEKYLGHTPNLYMTEFVVSNKQKNRDRQLEKMVKDFKPELREIKYRLGIVRSRIDMENVNSTWQVENILNAKKVA